MTSKAQPLLIALRSGLSIGLCLAPLAAPRADTAPTPVAATAAPAGSEATPATPATTTVDKTTWKQSFRDLFPAAICADGTYIRSCYTLSAAQCHQEMSVATDSCLLQYDERLPDPLQQPQDGRAWGGTIGQCAASLYLLKHSQQRRNDSRCEHPEAWR